VYFSKIPALISTVVLPGFGDPLHPRLAPFSERYSVYEARWQVQILLIYMSYERWYYDL